MPVPHGTGTLPVPSDTGTLPVSPFESRVLLARFMGFPCQSPKGFLIEFQKFQRGPNRISEIWERTDGTNKWDRFGQVRVRGTGGTGRRGSVSVLGGTGWKWDRGVFRLGGTGSDSGQVSVQMNQSTCPKVGLQGRETSM